MKNLLFKSPHSGACVAGRKSIFGTVALVAALFAFNQASAQTINAYDAATNAVYASSFASGQNGGFGFGDWTIAGSSGGQYIQGSTPTPVTSGSAFAIWLDNANNTNSARRSFNSPLTAGQTFSFARQINNLAGTNSAQVQLQDASGNTLFKFWHKGGDDADGHYADATTNNGTATGFAYNYQAYNSYSFKLTTSSNYVFRNITSGATLTGTITPGSSISQVLFLRQNGVSSGGGADFRFDKLTISSDPVSFQSQIPTANSYSGIRTNVSVQALDGVATVNTNTIAMTVDGGAVTPGITTVAGVTTISYIPVSPLSAGTLHSAVVTLADSNGTLFTNQWSFTTGFPALPATLPGPIATGNGNDLVIFTAAGEDWLGTNYNASSSRTIYVRQSMVFHDLNGETNDAQGGCYGGIHFFNGNTERLLTGETWQRNTWSIDDKLAGGELSLNPATVVVSNEWHTTVTKVTYTPGGDATVKVWLDPDFSQLENNQANGPLQVSMNNTFDNIRLRCGNGTANAEWTNIVVGATAAEVGFPVPVDPIFQGFIPAVNAPSVLINSPIGVQVVVGSVGVNTNDITVNLDGNPVAAGFSVSGGIITASYQPASPFSAGSGHTVSVNLTDTNGTPYSTSWSFTVDSYPTLPVTVAGPIYPVFASDGVAGITIFGNTNGWINGHYQSGSTNTLYARFSVVFYDLNNENGSGYGYGGLQFLQDNSERLITGNAWTSTNWSFDLSGNQVDITPVLPVVLSEWHTLVVKTVYNSGADDDIKVWLDPDFSKSEAGQPVPPTTVSGDNSFNNVRLRVGEGSAYAGFSNIVIAATAPEVGFALPAPIMSIQNGNLSWTGTGTLEEAPTVLGPWTDSANQNNPQVLVTTNSARFFRLRQ